MHFIVKCLSLSTYDHLEVDNDFALVFIPFEDGIVDLPFEYGDGTSGNPYQIWNQEQLEAVNYALSANYDLMADIDLSGTTYLHGVIAYSGVEFTGTFAGNGHTISNLTINAPYTTYVGLFGMVGEGAQISNVILSNVDVVGDEQVAGLIGRNYYAETTHCQVSGVVDGVYQVGGLVGNNRSSISNCQSSVTVTGGRRLGGLVGDSYCGEIDNCSASGNVTGSGDDYAGGLVGQSNNTTITNCSATGDVIGLARVGGLIGNNYQASTSDSYATGNVTGVGVNTLYTGGFVGQNHTSSVSNCYATGLVTAGDGADKVGGFVGNNYRGTIEDSYAIGDVSGTGYSIGGFIGYNQHGTVDGCSASGNVKANLNSGGGNGDHVGGFVGYNYGSSASYPATITNSFATGSVYGASNYVGGFCGRAITYAYISGCYSTGDVSGGATEVGGFIGRMSGGSNVQDCYSTGSATAVSTRVGGFVGGRWGDILANCYSTGTASGSANVGGFVGYGNATSTDCFWDMETSGLTTSVDGMGLTTAEMKTQVTFANWDFTTTPVWFIRETVSYPTLKALEASFAVADLDLDGSVDVVDLEYLAGQWLVTGTDLLADIASSNKVDLGDLAVMASQWTVE